MSPPDTITISSRHGPRTWIRTGEMMIKRRRFGVWSAACVICAEPFEIRAPWSCDPARSHAFHAVTCPSHRLTRTEIVSLATASDWRARFGAIRLRKLAETAE